jgi:hypothetical protein
MAVLPPRLQIILYSRLEQYNCVSSSHPKQLQKYGGVAICSGGCYKSLHDWYYLPASLFQGDLASSLSDQPLFFEVTFAPHCFLANGPYLRTTDTFNGYPVYAQITQLELQKLEECIQNPSLLQHLKLTAPNFGDRDLRAGERLLVRHNGAWVLQSVTAYRGFSKRRGECGFHFLHFNDNEKQRTKRQIGEATCFAGMTIDMKPRMEKCSAVLASCNFNAHDFKKGSAFCFDFGSRRCTRPTVAKGTDYKPHPTANQEFHSDGPTEHDATSIWKDGWSVNWKSDACLLSRLQTLTKDELLLCCLSRKLDTSGTPQELAARLADWLDKQEKTPMPIPDSMFQSLSALFAFYPNTALGVPTFRSRSSGTWNSLKLKIPMGTAVLFRFDFFHHGWKCVSSNDQQALPVHFRIHFYLFNGDLSSLPVVNFEAALEYLSVISHEDLDDATLLLMLESLQTFVPYLNPYDPKDFSLKRLDKVAESRKYKVFESQHELEAHCKSVSDEWKRVNAAT